MTDLNTSWRHYTGTIDDDGVFILDSSNAAGTHAIAGGGFATASAEPDTDTEVELGEDHGQVVPLVGSFPRYDSESDTTVIDFIFQGNPGASVRAHVWVHTA